MNRIDLLIRQEDLEDALMDLANQYKRCADEDEKEIIRDSYTAYQRKLNTVNAQLGQ